MLERLLYILAIAGTLVRSQSTSSQTFWPAAVPLAVHSPYHNAWMVTQNGTTPLNRWPVFWNGQRILGWSGFVRIDGLTYQWLGVGGPGNVGPENMTLTDLTNTLITPTRSIFTLRAGPMLLNVTFLSPIEPSDWVRQSFPFSYVYVDAMSVDGRSHSVQVYSDITAEWVSGASSNEAQWDTTQTRATIYHQARRTVPGYRQEAGDMAEDSTVYYGMALKPGVTWMTGKFTDVRSLFARDGKLTSARDTKPRPISEDFAVLSIAFDLENIQATTSPVVWAIGLVRDPVIRYVDASSGPQDRRSYFWSKYSNIDAAIDAFIADFPEAQRRAIALDQKILNEAMAISPEYADLLSLAVRQTMGGTDLTIPKSSTGAGSNGDAMMFMKNIGNGGRVNPVETIYASFPMFLYLNASLGGLLLEPLLRYQNNPQTLYAAPDVGLTYPNADGNTDGLSAQGVEDSGAMLIMALAHARISGDGSLISRYYNLFRNWAEYLVVNSMDLKDQKTADNPNKPNMSNLAIIGIIGIQAMSEISAVFGKSDDAQKYGAVASRYVKQWQELAGSSGHLLSSYDQPTSWGLIYNLFADRLLQTNLVDPKIYQQQEAFYADQASRAGKFGLEYDSNAQGEGRSDWTMFVASTLANNATRDQLVSMVHKRASSNETAGAFPTRYDVNNGSFVTQASPAQGAMFAMLSLKLENKTIVVPPIEPVKHRDVGAIAGGVVGSLALLALVALGVFFWRRRKGGQQVVEETHPMVTPYDPRPSWNQPPLPLDATAKPKSHTGKTGVYLDPSSSNLASSSSSSGQPAEYDSTTQLRTEMEHLRQEVQEMRYNQAPPSYQ